MAERSKAIGCKLIDYYLRRFKSYSSYQFCGYDGIGRHAKFRAWFLLVVVQVHLSAICEIEQFGSAHQAHNLKIVGSNPTLANFVSG